MTKKQHHQQHPQEGFDLHSELIVKPQKRGLGLWFRRNFLTGLVIAAPVAITVYLTVAFVNFVDNRVTPLIPERYNPETYLRFSVPGLGVIVSFFALVLLGALAANLFGRTIIATGERVVDRMPVIRSVYSALKQIFETAVAQSETTFREVALVEYPRKGIYAIGFISTATKGEIRNVVGEDLVSVFVPTTPNPTSGFLLFLPRKDVKVLEMSVEEAAKVVISAGLVEPNHADAAIPAAPPDLPGDDPDKSETQAAEGVELPRGRSAAE